MDLWNNWTFFIIEILGGKTCSFLQGAFIRDLCLLSHELKQAAFSDCRVHLYYLLGSTVLRQSHTLVLEELVNPYATTPAAAAGADGGSGGGGATRMAFDRLLGVIAPEISVTTLLERDGYRFLDLLDVTIPLLSFGAPRVPDSFHPLLQSLVNPSLDKETREREAARLDETLALLDGQESRGVVAFARQVLLVGFAEYMVDGYVMQVMNSSLTEFLGTLRKCHVCGGPSRIFCASCQDATYCDLLCERQDLATHEPACSHNAPIADFFVEGPEDPTPSRDKPFNLSAVFPSAVVGVKEDLGDLRDRFFATIRKRRQEVKALADAVTELLAGDTWTIQDHQDLLATGSLLAGSLEMLRLQLRSLLKEYVAGGPGDLIPDSLLTLTAILPASSGPLNQAALQLHALISRLLTLFGRARQLPPKATKTGTLYENDRLKREWLQISKELDTFSRVSEAKDK